LVRCTNTCAEEEGPCQAECCGRIFCKRSCLGTCADNERGCEAGCYDRLGGEPESAFFDTATLSPQGRAIHASGPLQCPEGAVAEISVTLSQLSGAIAKGETRVVCPDGETTFTVRTVVVGKPGFQALSTAQACATALIRSGSQSIRTLQWCRGVTLVPDGVTLVPDDVAIE